MFGSDLCALVCWLRVIFLLFSVDCLYFVNIVLAICPFVNCAPQNSRHRIAFCSILLLKISEQTTTLNRLENNRKAAQRSRQRKKNTLEALDGQVVALTRIHDELVAKNQKLLREHKERRQKLMEIKEHQLQLTRKVWITTVTCKVVTEELQKCIYPKRGTETPKAGTGLFHSSKSLKKKEEREYLTLLANDRMTIDKPVSNFDGAEPLFYGQTQNCDTETLQAGTSICQDKNLLQEAYLKLLANANKCITITEKPVSTLGDIDPRLLEQTFASRRENMQNVLPSLFKEQIVCC